MKGWRQEGRGGREAGRQGGKTGSEEYKQKVKLPEVRQSEGRLDGKYIIIVIMIIMIINIDRNKKKKEIFIQKKCNIYCMWREKDYININK